MQVLREGKDGKYPSWSLLSAILTAGRDLLPFVPSCHLIYLSIFQSRLAQSLHCCPDICSWKLSHLCLFLQHKMSYPCIFLLLSELTVFLASCKSNCRIATLRKAEERCNELRKAPALYTPPVAALKSKLFLCEPYIVLACDPSLPRAQKNP